MIRFIKQKLIHKKWMVVCLLIGNNLWKNSLKRTRKTKKTENKMRITKKNQKI